MRQVRDLLPDQNNLHLFSPTELDSGAEATAPAAAHEPPAASGPSACLAAEQAVDEAIQRPDQRFDIRAIGHWTPRIDALCSDYPFFGLSPTIEERRFQMANGDYVTIIPTARGVASVHDRDLLVFALSALVYANNGGVPISPRVRFSYSDFLRFTGRAGGGKNYVATDQALDRLRGTTVKISRANETRRERRGDGWIVSYREVEQIGRDRTLEMLLHPFVYRAVLSGSYLTIPREYFKLRSPVARRLFELASKNTRNGHPYTIRLQRLHEKLGFERDVRKLRFYLQKEMEPLPGMQTSVDLLRDQVTFTRTTALEAARRQPPSPRAQSVGDPR